MNFCELPPELIVDILGALDLKSLLRCRQACKLLNGLIVNAVALQYKIELAIAGMEDGPPSHLGPADRLDRLRRHQAAWHNLEPTSEKILPMLKGKVWELYGDVLAQARGPRNLAFWQLPCDIRGIEEKHWEVEDVGFKIRDFGMDPAQDLLLVIELPQVRSERTCRIHLRSLLTGRPHPAAPNPAYLPYVPEGDRYSFTISISGEFVGVMFVSANQTTNELVIWNWHTGAIEMVLLTDEQISSFAFLSDRHILLPIVGNGPENFPHYAIDEDEDEEEPEIEPTLFVVDFLKAPSQPTHVHDMDYECGLRYPAMQPWATALALSVRSDPGPSWTPSPDLKVPFHIAREERLFTLTFWVTALGRMRILLLFLPTSTVQKCLEMCTERQCFSWNDWSHFGTRMIPAPPRQSGVWVCYVYGLKYVAPMEARGAEERDEIVVFDFNQLAIRKMIADGFQDGDEDKALMPPESVIPAEGIFNESITTTLPCICRKFRPNIQGRERFSAVMISEDTIIAVYDKPNVREHRLMTF